MTTPMTRLRSYMFFVRIGALDVPVPDVGTAKILMDLLDANINSLRRDKVPLLCIFLIRCEH